MKPLLNPGESAIAGQQRPIGSLVLWDAVFALSEDGQTRLIAYVEGAHVAEFFARCLNEVPQLVLDLHEGLRTNDSYRGVTQRAEAFMNTLAIRDFDKTYPGPDEV